MDTSHVIFCTAAYNDKYVNLSKELLNSFLKHTTNSKLLVLTNNIGAYQEYQDHTNIIVKYDDYDHEKEAARKIAFPNDGSFPFNITYRVLQAALDLDVGISAHVICYLDADCRIKNTLNNEHFYLESGLYVPFTFSSDGRYYAYNLFKFPVMEIKTRVCDLVRSIDEVDFLQFREACLIFADIHHSNFQTFLHEWERLYLQIEHRLHPHGGQFFEISLALRRANFPLCDIMESSQFPYLQSTLMTLNYIDWQSEMSALR